MHYDSRPPSTQFEPPLPKREIGGVEKASARLEEQVKRLHSIVEQLSTRLGPVLRAEPCVNEMIHDKPEGMSELSHSLAVTGDRLADGINRIEAILHSIDL